MHGSPPTLDVTGKVTGFARKQHPGINSKIYLLELTITPPAPRTPVHQTVTDVDVR